MLWLKERPLAHAGNRTPAFEPVDGLYTDLADTSLTKFCQKMTRLVPGIAEGSPPVISPCRQAVHRVGGISKSLPS
jgi:hypothetical protein